MAASVFETSTMQAKLPFDDVDDRKVTEDAALAGSALTPKMMDVSTSVKRKRKFPR